MRPASTEHGLSTPLAPMREHLRAQHELPRTSWGEDTSLKLVAISTAHSDAARAWWVQLTRQFASRNSFDWLNSAFAMVICTTICRLRMRRGL